MEYLVRILMKDASVKAGRLIDGNVVISVSSRLFVDPLRCNVKRIEHHSETHCR